VSKGARFWGFLLSRVRGVLGEISSIPLDLASFGGLNLGYGVPMRCSYFPPKSCANPWSESGDRDLDLGELTRGLLYLTGLTVADPWLCFAQVNVLVSSLVSCVLVVSSLECFGALEVGFLELGFPGSHRSNR
jgi:hypothetical protein